MFNSTMSIKNKILLRKVLKYLVEGLAIAFVAFYIPRRKLKLSEILALSLTASTTLLILDTFTESNISDGTRFGVGFGVGANLVGFPAEQFDVDGTDAAHAHTGISSDVSNIKRQECEERIDYLTRKEENMFKNECNIKDSTGRPNCIVKKCDESPKPYEIDDIGTVIGSTTYNKGEWKDIRSKYCEQSGDKYYNIGENEWSDCTAKDLSEGSCSQSTVNFKDSECMYLEAENRIAQCGNGIVEGDEQCDDNNVNNSDGCSLCQQDSSYTCSNNALGEGPSRCNRI